MLLEVRDLHVAYGGVTALRGLAMSIPEGAIVSILGSNGAGKSTLLNTLMRATGALMRGSIRFDGVEISDLTTDRIVGSGVALVPEGRQLFPELTVMENLKLGAYLRRDRTEIAADLNNVLNMFPRLGERRDQSAATLSGGEQQMVAIGRAMMSRPRLLLLDEPSLGLAPVLVTEILKLVKRINQLGVTILLVEQNARQALRISTYAYVLEKGSVVASGTTDVLAVNSSITDAYLGSK